MNTHLDLERNLLRALLAAAGQPFPESALVHAARRLTFPGRPTTADVLDALRALEAGQFVLGVTEELLETTWTLTTRGLHKARQLA